MVKFDAIFSAVHLKTLPAFLLWDVLMCQSLLYRLLLLLRPYREYFFLEYLRNDCSQKNIVSSYYHVNINQIVAGY